MRFKSKHPYCILFLSLFLLGSKNLQEIVLVKTSAQTAAFVNVSVIPMDRERVLKDQTVVIQEGKIVEIGHVKKIAVPDGALRIEGRSLFLIPGLADLHVHMHSLSDVLLWLVHGVTTVRNMRGTPLHLTWRQLIAEGKMLGPTLFTCGPILDGSPASGESVDVIETKEEAEQNVANQKAAGYDCVKVYNRLSPLAYGAIMDAAKRYGLPVTGHVPSKVGLGGVLAAHQESIEHLTGFMTALKKDGNMINQSAISKVAKETNAAGVWNCPTLIVEEKLFGIGSLP